MKSPADKTQKNILCTAILVIVVCLGFICMGTYAYFTQDRTHIGGTVKTGEFPQEAILEGEPEKASPSEAPKMMLMAPRKATPSSTGEEAGENAEKAAQEGAAAGPDEPAGPGEPAGPDEQSEENAEDAPANAEDAPASDSTSEVAPEENLTEPPAESPAEPPADSAAEPPADNAAGAFEGAFSAPSEDISGAENSMPPDIEILTVEPLDF